MFACVHGFIQSNMFRDVFTLWALGSFFIGMTS